MIGWIFAMVRYVSAIMLTAYLVGRLRIDLRSAHRMPFPVWSLGFEAALWIPNAIALGLLWRALL